MTTHIPMMNKKELLTKETGAQLAKVCFLGRLSILTIPEICKSLEPRAAPDKML